MVIDSHGKELTVNGMPYKNVIAYDASTDNDFLVMVVHTAPSNKLTILHLADGHNNTQKVVTKMDVSLPVKSVIGRVSVDLVKFQSECEIVFKVNDTEKFITMDTGQHHD